jgi:hypothetical protein
MKTLWVVFISVLFSSALLLVCIDTSDDIYLCGMAGKWVEGFSWDCAFEL